MIEFEVLFLRPVRRWRKHARYSFYDFANIIGDEKFHCLSYYSGSIYLGEKLFEVFQNVMRLHDAGFYVKTIGGVILVYTTNGVRVLGWDRSGARASKCKYFYKKLMSRRLFRMLLEVRSGIHVLRGNHILVEIQPYISGYL